MLRWRARFGRGSLTLWFDLPPQLILPARHLNGERRVSA
jgi:hypothetical protein